MVLALSLWDDHYANMLWLDSTYPPQDETRGAHRGTCDTGSGDPVDVESNHPGAFVRYMNIAYGELGTTDSGPIPGPSPPAPPGPSPTPGPTPSPPHQCGSSDGCLCSPGMNNDGRNMESSARTASSPAECCNLCQQAEGCVGWTHIPSSGNQCWLKDQVGDLRTDGSVTSGKVNGTSPVPGPTPSPPPAPSPPHQCGSADACVCSPAMNNNGHNMDSSSISTPNETACCDACQKREGCVGWTFVPKDGNACWLKDEIGELTEDGYVTSGSLGVVPVPTPSPQPTPSPSPVPSNCPGGSLDACIDLCPSDDTDLFKSCVQSCQRRCQSLGMFL